MHRLIKNIFFLILFLTSFYSFAQSSDSLFQSNEYSFVVDSIRIVGNEVTEEFIIMRELTFGVGDTATQELLKFNRERIFSLGLFNRVELIPEEINHAKTIKISVEETWYIYPVPFASLTDGSFDRISYGVSLLWRNFRGRNETIFFRGALGYDPSLILSYTNPVIIEKTDISFNLSFVYQSIENKSPYAQWLYGIPFDYTLIGGGIGIGKRLNKFNDFAFYAGFNYLKTPEKSIERVTASGGMIDRAPYAGVVHYFDTRDLKQFPEKGILAGLEFMHFGFGVDKINYNVAKIDLRHYIKIFPKLTAKWRGVYRTALGRLVPLYDYSRLGIGTIVRGHWNDIKEGRNSILASIEAAFSILDEWNLSIKLPVLPTQLTSARIGIRISIFADTGTAFDYGDRVKWDRFYSGWGFGLTALILPFNALRVEYAFDENRNGEWLFGTGFSF